MLSKEVHGLPSKWVVNYLGVSNWVEKLWQIFSKIKIPSLNLQSCFNCAKWKIQGVCIIISLSFWPEEAAKQAVSWFLPPVCLGFELDKQNSEQVQLTFVYHQFLQAPIREKLKMQLQHHLKLKIKGWHYRQKMFPTPKK